MQENNYILLQSQCYACGKRTGHISIDCPDFGKMKGNLLRLLKKSSIFTQKKQNETNNASYYDGYRERSPELGAKNTSFSRAPTKDNSNMVRFE